MANNSTRSRIKESGIAGWEAFKMPAGGTSQDLRTRVQEVLITVSEQSKTLSGSYITPTQNPKTK